MTGRAMVDLSFAVARTSTVRLALGAALWAALTCATLLFLESGRVARFRSVGAPLVETRTGEDAARWSFSHSGIGELRADGGVSLTPPPDDPVGTALIKIPFAGPSRVRLTARIRGTGLESRADQPQGARLMLASHDREGRPRYDRDHLVAAVHGDVDWQTLTKVIDVEADVVELRAGLLSFSRTGTFEATDLVVERVELTPLSRALQLLLAAGWIAFLGALGRRVARSFEGRLARALVLGTSLVLLTFAVLPRGLLERPVRDGTSRAAIPVAVVRVLDASSEADDTIEGKPAPTMEARRHLISLDSLWDTAHVAGFAWLGALFILARRREGSGRFARWVGLLPAALLAPTSEVLQAFTPDRSPNSGDIVRDLVGLAFGAALGGLWLLLWRHRTSGQGT